jgi:hypothetical protein
LGASAVTIKTLAGFTMFAAGTRAPGTNTHDSRIMIDHDGSLVT